MTRAGGRSGPVGYRKKRLKEDRVRAPPPPSEKKIYKKVYKNRARLHFANVYKNIFLKLNTRLLWFSHIASRMWKFATRVTAQSVLHDSHGSSKSFDMFAPRSNSIIALRKIKKTILIRYVRKHVTDNRKIIINAILITTCCWFFYPCQQVCLFGVFNEIVMIVIRNLNTSRRFCPFLVYPTA